MTWLDDLAKMSLRAAKLGVPRWRVYKWCGVWRAVRSDWQGHPNEFRTWEQAIRFADRGDIH